MPRRLAQGAPSHPRCISRAQTPETDAFGRRLRRRATLEGLKSPDERTRSPQPPVERRAYSIAWRDAASSPLPLGTDHARVIRGDPPPSFCQRFGFFARPSPPRGGCARVASRDRSTMPPTPRSLFVSALSPAFPSHFYAFALRSFRNRTIRRALGHDGVHAFLVRPRVPIRRGLGRLGRRTKGTRTSAPTPDRTRTHPTGRAREPRCEDAMKINRHL